MRSGEVARRAGVSVDTLGHYERLGLMAAPVRDPNGYRRYAAAAVDRVRLIQRALEPATIDDVPANLMATGAQRRADIACNLFAAGHSFEMIDAAMALCAALDLALAEHIRNTLPALRGLTPEDACRHLIADIEQVRHALIGDA